MSVRDLMQSFAIWPWEIEQAAELGWLFEADRKDDDTTPIAYKAVRVWAGTKWWSTNGKINPVRWELVERRKKTDKLQKSLRQG